MSEPSERHDERDEVGFAECSGCRAVLDNDEVYVVSGKDCCMSCGILRSIEMDADGIPSTEELRERAMVAEAYREATARRYRLRCESEQRINLAALAGRIVGVR